MRKKLQSIADIALLAGVSKSTVSRALNDSPLIGQETKEKIRAIAESHGFRLNEAARALSRRASSTVAFVINSYGEDLGVQDLFSLEIMGGIAVGLHEEGYDLLVVHVDPSDTDWIPNYLDSGRVDGFILMTCSERDRHIERLIEMEAPFISWGLGGGRYCTVSGDNRRGGKIATKHLLDSGRRRIAFLGASACRPDGEEACESEAELRRRGYIEAHEDAGVALSPELLLEGDFSEAAGQSAVDELLERRIPFDALFAASDLMAIAAQRRLRARGLRVPEEVAVVGYDDLHLAAYVSPALTTVSQNIPLAGKILARDLVAHIETGLITNTIIPVELIKRDSA